MPSQSIGRALPVALAAVLLAACGSTGIGDILGGGGGDYPQQRVSEVRGTVVGVDTTGDCAIELAETSYTSDRYLRNEEDRYDRYGGREVVVYCDDSTQVVYQGRSYRPSALERGDRITVQVRDSGNRLHAQRIEVTYDVSQGGRYDDRYGNDRYDDRYDDRYADQRGRYADLRGEVVYVDRDRRTMQLDRVEVYDRELLGNSRYDRLTLSYDDSTTVKFEGRSYRPENLERGDVVEVEVDRVRGQLVADEVVVVEDVRAAYPR